MATDNSSDVGWALSLLKQPLHAFIERQFESHYGEDTWRRELDSVLKQGTEYYAADDPDVQALFRVITNRWNDVFGKPIGPLSRPERNLISDIWEIRRAWAHQNTFSTEDAHQALYKVEQLLKAITSRQSSVQRELEERKRRLLRRLSEETAGGEANAVIGEAKANARLTNSTPVDYAFLPGGIGGPHVTVRQDGKGDYTTISAAIREAHPNTQVEVHPGHYAETLVLDKPVELYGMGRREDIIIKSEEDVPCIVLRADYALVRGVTLLGDSWCGAEVEDGRLDLRDCIINAAVRSQGYGTSAIVRHCNIESGVFVGQGAQVTLEDCDISCPDYSLVVQGNLTARRCVIHICYAGIALEEGRAIVEDCEIWNLPLPHGDDSAAITIQRCAVAIRRCRIHGVKGPGVMILGPDISKDGDNASQAWPPGMLEECEIYDTKGPGLEFSGQVRATVRDCTIRHAQQSGVYITNGGQAVLEECTIHANDGNGIEIDGNSSPIIRRCTVSNNRLSGISVGGNLSGQAIVEDCELRSNAEAGVAIIEEGNAIVRRCHINHNRVAIYADSSGRGIVTENDLTGNNEEGPWWLEDGCQVRRERNVGDTDANDTVE